MPEEGRSNDSDWEPFVSKKTIASSFPASQANKLSVIPFLYSPSALAVGTRMDRKITTRKAENV
jgi:hypothetical protein